ncbi:Nickel/cobalt efflux system rcnA [Cedecea neteri]|uniref:Nickel/cobalt efflux system n=1 Tax=Cedecea neteri TaxID=158822 RepID=A0A2X3J8V8_9ENTR|nr:Nickel/cobalt efflux system rcnA [Cedecea neteri]
MTKREEGAFSQVFQFVDFGDYMESTAVIPEPHNFNVRLSFDHRGHSHDYDLAFHEQDHEHSHAVTEGLEVGSREYQDAHELAHGQMTLSAAFTNTDVTNGQILLFGLTGGLIPCPAAITVLLLCLQLKALTLGAAFGC